jgi:hypothetical protein
MATEPKNSWKKWIGLDSALNEHVGTTPSFAKRFRPDEFAIPFLFALRSLRTGHIPMSLCSFWYRSLITQHNLSGKPQEGIKIFALLRLAAREAIFCC